MTKEELRERVAHELWFWFTKSFARWAEMTAGHKKFWYKRADEFIKRTNLYSLLEVKP